MKKMIKSFTFWFIVLSLLEILMRQIGHDSKGIVLIGLTPILNALAKGNAANEFMDSGFQITCKTVGPGCISIYRYIGSVLTWALYGVVLDFIRYQVKRYGKLYYQNDAGAANEHEAL